MDWWWLWTTQIFLDLPYFLFVFFPPITECYTVPGAPPRNVTGRAISTTAIEVSWEPPPMESANGRIAYYKLQVVETGRSDSEARVIKLSDTKFILDELKKWTAYRIWVVAGTSVGDGPPSYPITVRTYEDGMYQWPERNFFGVAIILIKAGPWNK